MWFAINLTDPVVTSLFYLYILFYNLSNHTVFLCRENKLHEHKKVSPSVQLITSISLTALTMQ